MEKNTPIPKPTQGPCNRKGRKPGKREVRGQETGDSRELRATQSFFPCRVHRGWFSRRHGDTEEEEIRMGESFAPSRGSSHAGSWAESSPAEALRRRGGEKE